MKVFALLSLAHLIWPAPSFAGSTAVEISSQTVETLSDLSVKTYTYSFIGQRRTVQLFYENLRNEEGLAADEAIPISLYLKNRPGLYAAAGIEERLKKISTTTPEIKITTDMCLMEQLTDRNIQYFSDACSVLFRFRDQAHGSKKRSGEATDEFAELSKNRPAAACKKIIERINENLPLCVTR